MIGDATLRERFRLANKRGKENESYFKAMREIHRRRWDKMINLPEDKIFDMDAYDEALDNLKKGFFYVKQALEGMPISNDDCLEGEVCQDDWRFLLGLIEAAGLSGTSYRILSLFFQGDRFVVLVAEWPGAKIIIDHESKWTATWAEEEANNQTGPLPEAFVAHVLKMESEAATNG